MAYDFEEELLEEKRIRITQLTAQLAARDKRIENQREQIENLRRKFNSLNKDNAVMMADLVARNKMIEALEVMVKMVADAYLIEEMEAARDAARTLLEGK